MHPKISRLIISFVVFAALAYITPLIHAERLPVKIYTSADGLGSSFVDDLMRDSRGFMWFCTRDGLSRFDGSRFVTYQIGDKSSPPGIESILETRDGMYWISSTGGTFRFNPNENSDPGAASPHLNAQFISAARGGVFEDSAGTLWMLSGPSHLVERNGKFEVQKYELNLPASASGNFAVADIKETSDGSLWMDTSWGLVRRLRDNRIVYYPIDTPITSGNSSMMVDKNGRIWLARINKILVLKPEPIESFTGSEQIITRSLEPTSVVELIPEEYIQMPKIGGEIFQLNRHDVNDFVERSYSKRMFQAADATIWITSENNLMWFADGVFHQYGGVEGLPNVMGRMAEDAAGNLWIGGHAGLARLDRQGMVTFGTGDGVKSARFFAINEDPDGTMYFAGRDFYLSRFDGHKFQIARPNVATDSSFLWTSRFARRTSDGDWWILTDEKLYRFSGTRDFKELDGRSPTRTYTMADGLGSNGMFQIFEDSAGDIWISTRGGNGNGVARLKKGEESFHLFSSVEGAPENKAFSSAAEDRLGNIWFSYYEGGLARFNGERFEEFTEKDGLPPGVLPDLHIDVKGRLWIASAIAGLLRLDDTSSKAPSFVHLSTENGLTSNNVRTLTEDRFGRIYLGTARGVDRLSPDTGFVKHYSVNDGLAADFVVDSHCDKNGDLWFATNDGLSRLLPRPDEKIVAPRILLGGLRIAGESQAMSELGNAVIDKGELDHTQNNLQIEFFGLDFRAEEAIRYQYKLEGAVGEDWSPPSELRTVTYGNLQPATYRFLVRAVSAEGSVSEAPAVLSFKILPPIWARWWFILICISVLGGTVILLYRYRVARLREINVALAETNRAEENLSRSRAERIVELEKVRTRIATDLHDDIGSSLTQIAILSEVAQEQGKKGNGAAAEPLTKITSVSNELVGTMSDIVWSINPAKDHLSDLSQRMRRFASDVLTSRSIRLHFQADEAADDTVLNSNLRREVFLIFKESINNVVKHSGAKNVWAELNVELGNLNLSIRDDGRGFDPDDADVAEAGNGLSSMGRRTKEMGGSFDLRSGIGESTTIKVSFPIENPTATIPPVRVG